MSKEECVQMFNEEISKWAWDKDIKHPETKAWIVLIDGRRVRMQSNKCLWKQRAHAKNALLCELGSIHLPWPKLRDVGWYTYAKEVKQEWIKKHAEFITLNEWVERGCP